MRQFSIPAFVPGTVLLCQPVVAAITVFGNSDAQQRYESAHFGRGFGDKASCDRALSNPQLSHRDRASTLVNRGILLNRRKRTDEALTNSIAHRRSTRFRAQPISKGQQHVLPKAD